MNAPSARQPPDTDSASNSGFSPTTAVGGFLLAVFGPDFLAVCAGFLGAAYGHDGRGGLGAIDTMGRIALVVEIILSLGCLIGGGLLVKSGRRDIGIGLLVGWVVGPLTLAAYIVAG